jgi:DNA-binding GntR family transcriptional regulator
MSKAKNKKPNETFTPTTAAHFRTSTGRESTDLVIGHILDRLISGDLVPGERLNASRLVEALEVSVVPVREAIHFLAGEGVVELLPLKGARIREMNADEVVDWWHVFRVLAILSFEAAAENISKDLMQVELVADAIRAIEAAETSEAPLGYLLTLTDFHRVTNQIARKPVLDEAIRRLQAVYWLSFLPNYIPFDVYGSYFTQHYRLVGEAIMRGDGESASSIFKHHVLWSSAIIKGERPEPGAPWTPGIG